MKILFNGPATQTHWWHDKIIKCDHCKTEVQLERGDDVLSRTVHGKELIRVKCPTCPEDILARR